MSKKQKQPKFCSELRFDLVSKNWVVIASGRALRPKMFKKEKKEIELKSSVENCVFCNIYTQEKPVLIFCHGKSISPEQIPKNWTIIVIPNKYPAFSPNLKIDKRIEGGIYETINAVGYHEVVVFRSHKKQLYSFSIKEIKELIDVYQKRYLDLMKKKFVNYISIFHNHGKKAGASISHPHSQIITTPLIDTDLKTSLSNAKKYFKSHKKCVYCLMSKIEKENKKRIVYENKDFLAVCPFAPKSAFQIIISPKRHSAYFEKITEKEKSRLADAFQIVLKKFYKGLNNPDYNFYIHTAPCDGKNYDYYHWHLTILPKTSIWGGFELAAQMEISTIKPEKAAEYLRNQ